ncbi:hypothetical protein GCM10011348_33170 [Marinobacterium nitratireducens]|uniref:Polymerase beta nucleotidyltransferase domain-containing protein n=1 Tax=Marinobacterium nitratireducens TaxID=518897 RepID=A0A917ZMT1_9GAMM|nr:nucleotidyltransferase domain-containing protein [Marinobacterium nitratireducens]GGO85190.1 hypothetical protein GCM10011348_33170 [Marinobacterium nitratireducens]
MTNDGASSARELVLRLLSGALGPGIEVYVFGSRARGDACHASDLDVLLRSTTPIGFAELAEASERLSESDLPFSVDLLDDARISDAFRQRIDVDLVSWGRTD